VKINKELDKENFEALLDRLSNDRAEAGVKFEHIRSGLIRFFRLKGCHDTETLADETMNRVINRVDSLNWNAASPSAIFHGFARNVFLEYIRSARSRTIQFDDEIEQQHYGSNQVTDDPALDCLRNCLGSLKGWDGDLIVAYYRHSGQPKVDARRRLAEHNELSVGALHTKIHRIKALLRPCVEKCVESVPSVRK
jgi:DNA-directed RNA polymerase specialized sigma24 family protein